MAEKVRCPSHGSSYIIFDKDGLPICEECNKNNFCPSCKEKTMYSHTCRKCLKKEND